LELEQARATRVLGTALAADSDSDPCPCNSVLHKSLDVRLTKCYTSTTRNGKLKHTERILSPENSFHIHSVRRRKKSPNSTMELFLIRAKPAEIAKKLRAMADPGRTHGSLDVTLEFRPLQARTLKFLIVDQFCGHTTRCKDV